MNPHDRTALNRIPCQFGCRAVEQSEATGPPAALCIDVSTSFEQHLKHLAAANPGNNRCIESSDRIVDPRLHLRILFEKSGEQNRVMLSKRLLEQLHRIACVVTHAFILTLNLNPAPKCKVKGRRSGKYETNETTATARFAVSRQC